MQIRNRSIGSVTQLQHTANVNALYSFTMLTCR